jgi:hypothetical protein
MRIDREKTEFNARVKASMREHLASRTWPEKIRSIERMNRATRTAREAMKRALAKEAAESAEKAQREDNK